LDVSNEPIARADDAREKEGRNLNQDSLKSIDPQIEMIFADLKKEKFDRIDMMLKD
jgi:hypothetical protein